MQVFFQDAAEKIRERELEEKRIKEFNKTAL
jgi:hypothetical protein